MFFNINKEVKTVRNIQSCLFCFKQLHCDLIMKDVFYVRRETDLMKTAKVNAYIFEKTELLSIQEVFHVYLNKFENAVTHLFLVILGNN